MVGAEQLVTPTHPRVGPPAAAGHRQLALNNLKEVTGLPRGKADHTALQPNTMRGSPVRKTPERRPVRLGETPTRRHTRLYRKPISSLSFCPVPFFCYYIAAYGMAGVTNGCVYTGHSPSAFFYFFSHSQLYSCIEAALLLFPETPDQALIFDTTRCFEFISGRSDI